MISRTIFSRDIERVGIRAGVDPDLVESLIVVESNGHHFAWNPEPRYPYLWDVKTKTPFRKLTLSEINSNTPPSDFPALSGDRDQEWQGQRASWGLMQVMGALARERGFVGPYLPELCRPELNLEIGTTYLSGLMRWANGDVPKALAAYNAGKGGANSEPGLRYAQKVLTVLRALGPRP